MSQFSQAHDLHVLVPQSQDSGHYWLINVAHRQVLSLDSSKLAQALDTLQSLIFCPDAKSLINQHKIKPTPHLRIACLSSIKKLLHRNNLGAELELPSFVDSDHALEWAGPAIASIVDKINERGLGQLIALECQVIPATIAMEQAGLAFNRARWHEALAHFEAEAAEIKFRLQKYFQKSEGFALFGPEAIDLNNSQEVKARLEEILGVKLASTSQSSLKGYDHEAVKLLVKYREHARMISTYGETFINKISHNRIYATFVPLGSASGRFACHEPNLQALPNDPAFQACLEPEPSRTLIYFDYGAFELRILAGLSADPKLIQIFNDQQDIHSMVAQAVFGVQVSKSENSHLRDQAKVLNFGLIYGMGEHALARQLNMSLRNAEELMKNYFARFPSVLEFLESLEARAHSLGYVNTALGRRVYFHADDKPSQIGRIARNVPIQGTGADIAKLALCKVFNCLYHSELDAKLVNMVHDELVIECHEDAQAEVELLVSGAMSEAFEAILPNIAADVSVTR